MIHHNMTRLTMMIHTVFDRIMQVIPIQRNISRRLISFSVLWLVHLDPPLTQNAIVTFSLIYIVHMAINPRMMMITTDRWCRRSPDIIWINQPDLQPDHTHDDPNAWSDIRSSVATAIRTTRPIRHHSSSSQNEWVTHRAANLYNNSQRRLCLYRHIVIGPMSSTANIATAISYWYRITWSS